MGMLTESEVTVVTSLGGGVVISGGRASTLMKKSLYTYLYKQLVSFDNFISVFWTTRFFPSTRDNRFLCFRWKDKPSHLWTYKKVFVMINIKCKRMKKLTRPLSLLKRYTHSCRCPNEQSSKSGF